MKSITVLFMEHIEHHLKALGWGCDGCPKVGECGDQSGTPSQRYCWAIVEAAIRGEGSFLCPREEEKTLVDKAFRDYYEQSKDIIRETLND